jgi:pimeloyl-ACP methyl ester carboxylesterase
MIDNQYKLAATYCTPASGPGDTIQILTHGVGFDRTYWDYPFNNYNYSYVDRAIEQGYSTLAWDRLGIADSSHGDPINEIQMAAELEALHQLTLRVDSGTLCGMDGHRFQKKVHVGHSFGSLMTYGLSSKYPNITDAIVLTGFSHATSFIGLFVLGGNFVPVSDIAHLKDDYVVGYVAPDDKIGVHIQFFGPKDFDPALLKSATKTGQPATYGELLTQGSAGAALPSKFGGPVYVITGNRDIPFCGGNCHNTMAINGSAENILEASRPMFANAKVFNSTIVPEAGHGLNFGYSHTFTYQAILDFLKAEL